MLKAWVTFNPAKCNFCSQCYKTYENLTNAASAALNHATSCAETNLMIKGDGPTFPQGSMALLDCVYIIEAKMTKYGGLDFETNIEWLLTSLVERAVCYRVEFFQKLLDEHKLEDKRRIEEKFGVNIPFLRLIANGQIFNPYFVHPMDDLKEANNDRVNPRKYQSDQVGRSFDYRRQSCPHVSKFLTEFTRKDGQGAGLLASKTTSNA